MKKLLLITVCLMLLCEVKCYARIGETLEQCEKRYGKRITDKSDIMQSANWMLGYVSSENIGKNGAVKLFDETYYFFRLDKFVVYVEMYNDKVGVIAFMHQPLWNRDSAPLEMSKDEIDAIVGANTKNEKCQHVITPLKVLFIFLEEYRIIKMKKRADSKKEQDDKEKNVLKKF